MQSKKYHSNSQSLRNGPQKITNKNHQHFLIPTRNFFVSVFHIRHRSEFFARTRTIRVPNAEAVRVETIAVTERIAGKEEAFRYSDVGAVKNRAWRIIIPLIDYHGTWSRRTDAGRWAGAGRSRTRPGNSRRSADSRRRDDRQSTDDRTTDR